MTISEKVAYLKGLAEGLNLDTEKSKEGKLISVMIGILEEVGLTLEDLEDSTAAMGEELDAISDDLADVEEIVFDDDDEEEGCCHRGHCHCHDDDDFFEVEYLFTYIETILSTGANFLIKVIATFSLMLSI